MQLINVRITSVYGQRMIYPVCEMAKTFAAIAGTKTLKPDTIEKIQQLGYSVAVQPEAL